MPTRSSSLAIVADMVEPLYRVNRVKSRAIGLEEDRSGESSVELIERKRRLPCVVAQGSSGFQIPSVHVRIRSSRTAVLQRVLIHPTALTAAHAYTKVRIANSTVNTK